MSLLDQLKHFPKSEHDAPSDNDRAWFRANPKRNYRIRRLIGAVEEAMAPHIPGGQAVVVVWRMSRGMRMRKNMYLPSDYVWPSDDAGIRPLAEAGAYEMYRMFSGEE